MISRSTIALLWCLSIGFSATNLIYSWTVDGFGRWGLALGLAALTAQVFTWICERSVKRAIKKGLAEGAMIVLPPEPGSAGDTKQTAGPA